MKHVVHLTSTARRAPKGQRLQVHRVTMLTQRTMEKGMKLILPFSSTPQGLLPSSYTLCSSHLTSRIKKLRSNPSVLAEYNAII